MHVLVTREPADFAEHVGDFLASRPIEHNVLATVVDTLAATDGTDGAVFAWVAAGGEVVGAALRTPPRGALVSCMSADVAAALVPSLLAEDPGLPGANGPQPAVSWVAEAWRQCTGGIVEPVMSQGVYWLARVTEPPTRPAGLSRAATHADRDLLIRWARAFARDLGVPATDPEAVVDRRLRDGRLFVWADDDPVAMVGTSPPLAGVVRLGPVYTPPEARRRGYATALVANVSARILTAGASRCMLYTDLANPTSNKIYQAIGYRRASDAQEYSFRVV